VFDASLTRLPPGSRGSGEVGRELAVPDSSELVVSLLAELSVLGARLTSL
jgi:hypothetical protein